MAKSFKIRLFIVIFALTVLITSVTAISVSYAKWTGDSSGIAAVGTVGSWKEGSAASVGAVSFKPLGGSSVAVQPDSYDVQDADGKIFSVNVTVSANGSFELYIDGNKIEYEVQGDSFIKKNADGSYSSVLCIEMTFTVVCNIGLQGLWFY